MPGGRGSQASVEHLEASNPVGEIGRDRSTGCDGLEKIDDPVDEAVLVADDVPRRPPIRYVGVGRLRRENGAKSLRMAGIASEKNCSSFIRSKSNVRLPSLP